MSALYLNDIRTFVAVAEAGTPTAAAKGLHIPASTVSRSLTRLASTLVSCWYGGAQED